MDGVSVCRRLRAIGVTTPVLMLTARGAVRDRIDGLDAGADDYLSKPFDLDELLARLRALHRRAAFGPEGAVAVGDLVLDPAAAAGLARRRGDRAVGPRVRHPAPAGRPRRPGRDAVHHPRRGLGRRDRPAQQRDRRARRRASGPRSTGRSAPRRSPRCAAPATASTRLRDPAPDREPLRDARRAGRLPLRVRLVAGFSAAMLVCSPPPARSSTGGSSTRSTAQLDNELSRATRRSTPLVGPAGRVARRRRPTPTGGGLPGARRGTAGCSPRQAPRRRRPAHRGATWRGR